MRNIALVRPASPIQSAPLDCFRAITCAPMVLEESSPLDLDSFPLHWLHSSCARSASLRDKKAAPPSRRECKCENKQRQADANQDECERIECDQ